MTQSASQGGSGLTSGNRKHRWGWAVLAAVSLIAAGMAWRSGHGAAPGAQSTEPALMGTDPPPQSVTLAVVQRRDLGLTAEAAGTLVPLNTVEIHPQLTATVRQVVVREGQAVRPGDLLFTLDDRAEQAALAKARATLLRDQATLADLQRQWQRAQDLRAQNFIAQSAADAVQSQLQAQQALVASDEAAVDAAKVSAGFGDIRSHLQGQAGAVAVHPGSLVQPGGAALVSISQLSPIGVSFSVAERDLPGLLGTGAQQVLGRPVTVQIPALPGQAPRQVTGQVSFLDNQVDTTTGTIRLKAELANAGHTLWPGQYVKVSLSLGSLSQALVVPQAALIQRGQERLVVVADAQHRAALRPVTLRATVGEWAAVDGLQEGEQVVVEGKQNLRAGTPLKGPSPEARP